MARDDESILKSKGSPRRMIHTVLSGPCAFVWNRMLFPQTTGHFALAQPVSGIRFTHDKQVLSTGSPTRPLAVEQRRNPALLPLQRLRARFMA
jgi:hypothetical protein